MRALPSILCAAALLAAGLARAQDAAQPPAGAAPPAASAPAEPPALPEQPAAAAQPPPGQWVHTAQYGWVWMPYGAAYSYQPPEGGTPSMYVFYPAWGWSWVTAPWLWGWGPWPYFGPSGYARFGWAGYWSGYRGGHWWGGGVRPIPRGGVGPRAAPPPRAPAARPGHR